MFKQIYNNSLKIEKDYLNDPRNNTSKKQEENKKRWIELKRIIQDI
jgi:hypothetical protein